MKNSSPKIKIIIADDHPVFRSGMESALKSMTFISKVAQAAHGEEVLRILAHEHFDIVLMDIKMSPMSGLEATELVSARHPAVKVIAMSMHDDEKNILEILEKGALGYLIKNADRDEIEEAILEVVGGKEYFSKEVSRVMFQKVIHSSKQLFKEQTDNSFHKERCREIIFLLCHELTAKEIGNILCLSKRTVDAYRIKINETTGSKNLAGIVKYALSANIPDDTTLLKKFEKHISKKE